MIESVDPDDKYALSEIESAFWSWYKPEDDEELVIPEVATSRDALKAIRPDGWMFDISHVNSGLDWGCEMQNLETGVYVGYTHGTDPCFATEELAELWAIISAIEWERNNESNT